MLRALYTSATGMKAQEMLIDNTANNLANVNTTAFKRSRMDFADLYYTNQRAPGSSVSTAQVSPTGLQIGNGVRVVATSKSFVNGTAEQTGNPLDVAIEGDGFYPVQINNGETRYTRAGSFKLDSQGRLTTSDGDVVLPGITITSGSDNMSITVGKDGTVQTGTTGSDQGRQTVVQIQIATFLNPAGLSSEGNNLYAETVASGAAQLGNPGATGYGQLNQGFLEGSNVEVVTELISLIAAQRAYEINSRAIRAGDEMLSTSIDIIR
ncbi:MAG: flagellar basal-body rod protein FlgG [Fuerstia sp.]|nr:flagellar basal-body rod protein FlgG [Fuerstiella sp.]